MIKSRLLALVVLAAIVLLVPWTRTDQAASDDRGAVRPTSAEMDDGAASVPTAQLASDPALSRAVGRQPAPLPPSLTEVAVDGRINVDLDGRVLPDRDLRRLFDFLLTALGEQDLAAARSQLQAIALDQVDHWQAQQVLDLFERYLHYLRMADHLVAGGSDLAALAAALDQLVSLRRDLLGSAMAEGFFGEQERYDRLVLERLAMERDPMLSAGEVGERIKAWEDELPPQLLQQRLAATAHLEVVAETRVLNELDVTAAQRHRLRTERYGPEAADRLAALDLERQTWQLRVDDYFRERDRIESSLRTAAQREMAVAALEATFTDSELRRLAAMARIRNPQPR